MQEIDVRAGGGQTITIGGIVRHMLTKLEWHATLFPRIPVPIQKDLEKKLSGRTVTRTSTEPVHGLASSSAPGNNRKGGTRDDGPIHDNYRYNYDLYRGLQV